MPETAGTAKGHLRTDRGFLYSEVKVVQYRAGRECHSHACYVTPLPITHGFSTSGPIFQCGRKLGGLRQTVGVR